MSVEPPPFHQMIVGGQTVRLGAVLQNLEKWSRTQETAAWMRAANMIDSLDNRFERCWVDSRGSADTVVAWLAALVAAPTVDEYDLLARLLLDPFPTDLVEARVAWLNLGDGGAIAYAAGLTLAEAMTRQTGTHSIDDLHVLAAMRGWKFPPPEVIVDPGPDLSDWFTG